MAKRQASSIPEEMFPSSASGTSSRNRKTSRHGGMSRSNKGESAPHRVESDSGAAQIPPSRSSTRPPEAHSLKPNLKSSDPYEILGVPKDAPLQKIKSSYRKLALQYHPDKLPSHASEQEREASHKHFAAIGNAYEILGDQTRRDEYDEERRRESELGSRQRQQNNSFGEGFYNDGSGFSSFHTSGFSMFQDDPFFAPFGRKSREGRTSRNSRSGSSFHAFTDPFEIFEQFFADEIGNPHHPMPSRSRPSARSSFGDDLMQTTPFFGHDSLFSGMMSRHMNMMDSMMSQMNSGTFNSSSHSSSAGNGRHKSVSTSSSTTIVNGVRKTVTERTIVYPDGRVERQVETTEGKPDVTGATRLTAGTHPALGYDHNRGSRRRF